MSGWRISRAAQDRYKCGLQPLPDDPATANMTASNHTDRRPGNGRCGAFYTAERSKCKILQLQAT